MQPLLLLTKLLFVATSAPPGLAADTAITGARIEIGDGRIIESGTVVIHDGKIASVSESGAAPAGATIIDGKGLTVYPGFIDAYSTSGLKLPTAQPSGKTLPDTRNTAPATMWKENRKGIRADVAAAKCLDLKAPFTDQFSNGITTVLYSSGEGSLAGTAALVNLTATPKVLIPEVAAEIVLRGGGGGRGGDEMAAGQRPGAAQTTEPSYPYPSTAFGVFALMRQTLYDAKANLALAKPVADPIYDGLKSLVTNQIPVLFTVSSAKDITRASHVVDEFGFKLILNGAPDAYRVTDLIKKYNPGVILSLDLPDEPDKKPGTGKDATPARVLEDRWSTWKERQGNAKALDDAGITIAFRGGAGLSGYLAGVRRMAKTGLSHEATLKAMSLNAAKIFGVSDRLGTIEAGKLANLVVMKGDFADDKSTVKMVFVEGVKNDLSKEVTK